MRAWAPRAYSSMESSGPLSALSGTCALPAALPATARPTVLHAGGLELWCEGALQPRAAPLGQARVAYAAAAAAGDSGGGL